MRFTLLAISLLSAGIASAAIPKSGEYASIFGGYTFLPNNINNITLELLRDNVSYQKGFNAGARFGYSHSSIRYEGEYTYLQAIPSSFYINHVLQNDISGRSKANLLMFNIYYDTHEMLPAITAFLGVGIGYANLHTSLNSQGPNGLTDFNVKENEFAYQGTAGFTYNVTEKYALNLAYRYVAATESNYGKVFQAHLADIGLIYHFDCTTISKDME